MSNHLVWTYDAGTYTFDPAPFVASVGAGTTHYGPGGYEIYSLGKITLDGYLVRKEYDASCIDTITREMSGIYALYGTKGYLNLFSGDYEVISVSFDENDNYWADTVDYTIVLESTMTPDNLGADKEYYVSSFSNRSTLETIVDNGKYHGRKKLTYNISAQGIQLDLHNDQSTLASDYGGNSGLIAAVEARKYVNAKSAEYNGTYGGDGVWDVEGSYSFDEFNGTCSLTLTAILGGEAYSYESKSDISMNDVFDRTVTIEGTVYGLSAGTLGFTVPENSASKSGLISGGSENNRYDNALEGFNKLEDSYERALNLDSSYSTGLLPLPGNKPSGWIPSSPEYYGNSFYAGHQYAEILNYPLNKTAAKSRESHLPMQGQIQYSYTYDTYPEPIISGAITESVSMTSKASQTPIETIQILGRRNGPIVKFSNFDHEPATVSITYEGNFGALGYGEKLIDNIKQYGDGSNAYKDSYLRHWEYPEELIYKIDVYLGGFYPQTEDHANYVLVNESKTTHTLTNRKIVRSITWEYAPKCPEPPS